MRARFPRLVAAEWVKFWSLRSTALVLGLGMAGAVYNSWHTGQTDYAAFPKFPKSMQQTFGVYHAAFNLPSWLLLMAWAGTIGALTVAGEHASGQIRTTLTAVPARGRVLLAKAVVVCAVMTVLGWLQALIGYHVAQSSMAGRGFHLKLSDQGVGTAILSSGLVLGVSAAVGVAIGALIRHVAASIVTVFVVLMFLPLVFHSMGGGGSSDISQSLVAYAWSRLSQTDGLQPRVFTDLPSPAHAWTVFALWPLLTMCAAVVVLRRRDV